MKVAVVVQRFGENIIGGAESHAMQLALRLSELPEWKVDVYTTTAFSYQTWSDFYPEGPDSFAKLTIFRYRSILSRWPKVFGAYNRLVSRALSYWGKPKSELPRIFFPFFRLLESLWFFLQGPWCPALVKALAQKKDDYDYFIFFTYLYYPTVFGLNKVREKAVLIPLAHQEEPLSFRRVRELLQEAPLLFANSVVEKNLLLHKKLSTTEKIHVVGCGIDDELFSKHSFSMVPIPGLEKPYITYLGRISRGKGVHHLIESFLEFLALQPESQLSLVLAGENDGSINISYHPQIKFIGYVSQKDKLSLIAHASCVVNPSPKESLSLLVLEAIVLSKPVLVNGQCDVLKYYAQNLNTVFAYQDSQEFISHLDRIRSLVSIDEFRQDLSASKQWVQNLYSWENVLSHYKNIRFDATESRLKKEVF